MGVDLETTTSEMATPDPMALLERATDAAVSVLALRQEWECPSGVITSPLLAPVAAEVAIGPILSRVWRTLRGDEDPS